MSKFNRIAWNEGMFLGPHHFQQWDRFHQGELDFLQGCQRPHAWGAQRLAIDQEALANGRFLLLEVDGVLPDGSVVRAPSADPLPPSRQFTEHFGANQNLLEVFIALPDERSGVPLCQAAGQTASAESRYVGEMLNVTDLNRPGRETEITAARQNLKIMLGGENLDGFITLKVAEIERNNEGRPILRRDYAAPSLSLAAAGPVQGVVRGLLETLSSKSTALAAQTRQREGDMVEFTSSDVGSFWLLHTVNSYIPLLTHFQDNPDTHPLDLYFCLAQLGGALCTFGVGRHPGELPAYDHEKIGETFCALETHIRDLLSTVMPSRYSGVPLEQKNDTVLAGDIRDERLLADGVHWYLSVSGELPEARIRDEVPTQVIIGSPHNLDFLVKTATSGVTFTHVPVPPRDFPLTAGHVYFKLETTGETWSTIQDSRGIGVYLGGPELRELHYELIAMK